MKVCTGDNSFEIENALFIPELRRNLFCVACCTDKEANVLFTQSEVVVLDSETDNEIMRGFRQGDLYSFPVAQVDGNPECNIADTRMVNTANLWHYRMDHRNLKDLLLMINK
eukprot:CAMPEP_0117859016 /NCGR_PEP_ID=MMETSP0950-20121206/2868_1 /TAXON_ID=44440 /ORGANISM="Chattonella subsalsa, Strain CCMP2191" /LENGTH=111 /DNA_ID=CAMNT_0005708781 /DNA_START=1087 /DNA_END=1422 /DNA_ORIENTATION=-